MPDLVFDAPERVRFRYRLEGLDADWVEAGTRRMAFYSYVPPGNYRFRVIACNSDGVWSETGANLGLTVLPHFWQNVVGHWAGARRSGCWSAWAALFAWWKKENSSAGSGTSNRNGRWNGNGPASPRICMMKWAPSCAGSPS